MKILLNSNRQDAVDELKQLLAIAAMALDPLDNSHQRTLSNAEAVALSCFLDDIAGALPQLCK